MLQFTSSDYADYIKKAYDFIHSKGDYITALDADTGDGDHWINMDMGFGKLNEKADELGKMNISDELKQIGMIMMSVIGGSSGVLYGSAYLSAAAKVKGKETLAMQDVCDVLDSMLKAIMERGKAKEGMKTMIDSLAPAVKAFQDALVSGKTDQEICELVARASEDGAENTKTMEAFKGRATYQANKGLGHLDPGAVTMSYQILTLMDCMKEKLS